MTEALREIGIVALGELQEQARRFRILLFGAASVGIALVISVLTSMATAKFREATEGAPEGAIDKAVWSAVHGMARNPLLADFITDIPPVVLAIFALCIYVVPFLSFIVSHDAVSGDIDRRSIRYELLRCRRWAWFGGKVTAHLALFIALTAVMFATPFVYGALRSGGTPPDGDATLYALRFWGITLVYGGSFVILTVAVSALFTRHAASLLASFAFFFVLWWLRNNPRVGAVSPFHYHIGLWHPWSTELAQSLLAYGLFAFFGLLLGVLVFAWRDL